ncbi:PAP/OAS1 substrate-binding domain-containing protein, partial [Clavulina sp. PMI_390]
RQLFFHDLSQCLFDFVIQLLPTAEEMAIKEDVRRLLEKLIKTIEPESRLLSFGSTANGFSLRNSGMSSLYMDLCCLLDSKGPQLQASDLVTMLGDLLERETKFHVKTLPFARIPIVKLSLDPSPGLPFGISCDIGFENRLALENTRLLLSYASVDPTRVRTMVLFLKVWTKRRKINSPYRGTLSSYGYVLLVIYFLVHVKNPPVLPNLQSMPPLRPISHEDMHIGENNIWFFDDIELLRQKWQSSNLETVAELLVDFFKYYSKEFSYNTDVVSIRAGFMTRESKGWQTEPDARDSARERNRFCIEDPFETGYNVARTVTKDGLYTIRGEFMRASRILSKPQDRALVALAQLCEERGDELVQASAQYTSNSASTAGGIPRLPPLPPQVPYTVSSSQHAPAFIPIAVPDARTPPRRLFEPLAATAAASPKLVEGTTPLLQHMAPTRSKWTSPPPPDAPEADQDSYRNNLGLSLSLATSSTPARETIHTKERSPSSSSNASDASTNEED